MCAIAGTLDLKMDEPVIVSMLSTMKRRGPDGSGVRIFGRCCLLHTRLSVIDPTGGAQPMVLSWAGEEYAISYNGELYNAQELRARLIRLGHTFAGHSDTEVLLHAYVQWGEKCLEDINGIFAFAVWEKNRQRLFMARDRMGVKPLFYKEHKNGLLFSSEIKTILAYPGVRAELDIDGISQILLLGPGRAPGSGVFKGICELKPGYCAYWSDGSLRQYRYWKLQDREHTESFEDTADYIRWLVKDAIERQMVSDVPIGTFLSGGLDSSLITAVCAEKLNSSGEQLKTFSVDYDGNDIHFKPEKFQPSSDNEYIHIVQQLLSTKHSRTLLSTQELSDALTESTLARDLPGMADVDFSLLAFCKEIRKDVKVALSGECADEIFGGYPWFRDPEVLSANGFPWAQNTAYRATFLAEEFKSKIDAEAFVMDHYRDTVADCDILPETPPDERRIKEMVNLNQQWFMQTLLDRKDRMSMYSGLEVRVPFCDHRIAEYLYGVPVKFKDYKNKEKGLLRHAMRGFLPESVLWRKKSPYPKTYDPSYLSLMINRLKIILADRNSPIFQIASKEALEDLLSGEFHWPWYGQLMRIPQTIAYMIQINTWLECYNIHVI